MPSFCFLGIAILLILQTLQCCAFHFSISPLFVGRAIPQLALRTELHEHLHADDIVGSLGTPTTKNEDVTGSTSRRSRFFSFNPKFVENFFRHILEVFIKDPDTLDLTAKISSWVSWSYILLSILGTIGFDTAPLLSLLSVSGLTVGFAAKDILTSTFKGFYILLTKPFSRGWTISVNGFSGEVLSIDIRYVKLLSSLDKREILVPLSMVYGSCIIIERKNDI